MKKKCKLILVYCLCFCYFLHMTKVSHVQAKVDTNQVNTYNNTTDSQIPQEVLDYAFDNYLNFADIYYEEKEDISALSLGTPYTIFDTTDYAHQDAIFYFPLVKQSEIVLIFSVYITENGIQGSISDDISDELNDIQYLKGNYILYRTGEQEIVAENLKEKNTILSSELNTYNTKEASAFAIKSIAEKRKIIKDNTKLYYKLSNEGLKDEKYEYSPSNVVTTSSGSTEVRLSIKSKLASQGSDPICWAACIASINNYRKNTSLTAKNVCSALNHSISGATKSEITNGLEHYNLPYVYQDWEISWSKIKNDIDACYPVYMLNNNTSTGVGHASLVTGYRKQNEMCYVRIYNPQGEGSNIWTTYTSSLTWYVSNSTSYLWNASYYVC